MSFEYTRDRYYPSVVRFFSNNTYGVDMNQNITFGGTPHKIHNGTDSTEWTGSIEAGSGSAFDFASTDQANTGTKSVDATGSLNGNYALFSKPSSTIAVDDYVAITGYIYITSWSTLGTRKDVDVELRNNGVVQGNRVSLSDYIDTANFNSWQKFSIPLADFGLTNETADEFGVETIDEGAGSAPNYYLDDIQFEETNATAEFRLTPPEGKLYTIWDIKFSIVAPWSAMASDGSKPEITYNKFMDMNALDNGLVVIDNRIEGIRFSAALNNNMDFMQLPVANWEVKGYDETNAIIEIHFDFNSNTPVLLDDAQGDYNSITISTDLSSLLFFRASARGTLEDSI